MYCAVVSCMLCDALCCAMHVCKSVFVCACVWCMSCMHICMCSSVLFLTFLIIIITIEAISCNTDSADLVFRYMAH